MKMSSVFTALRMQGASALFVRYVSSHWYGRGGITTSAEIAAKLDA